VAVSALSLTRPAAAQQSPYLPAGPAGHVSAETETETVNVSLSGGQGLLEEMKVELAWQADVATFPCTLGAHVSGANLEARGYVPNEAVKERALEIARKHSFLPVVDALKIHHSLAMRTAGVPAETVRKEAAEVLVDALGERGRGLECKARPNGQVTVTGLVVSVEEKVEVGRKLRQVHGCTCVVNHLTVPTVKREGRMVTLVTSDGANVAQGPLPDLEEVVQHGTITSVAPASPTMVELPMPTMVTAPVPAAPASRRGTAALPWALPPGTPPWTAPGAAHNAHSPYASVETAPARVETPMPRVEMPMPRLTIKTMPVVETMPDPPTPSNNERPLTNLSGEAETLPVPRVAPSTVWPVPTAPPEELPAPKPTKTTPAKPVSRKPTPPADGARLKLTTDEVVTARHVVPSDKKDPGVDLLKVPAVPASWSGTTPATGKKGPAPAVPTKDEKGAYVTTGSIVFDEEQEVKAQPVSAAKLKQRVEQTCGKFAKSVKVVAAPDKSLIVKVKVANASAEKPLTERILKLPEMASPAVRLEMEVK
jgi:hypothetical protein